MWFFDSTVLCLVLFDSLIYPSLALVIPCSWIFINLLVPLLHAGIAGVNYCTRLYSSGHWTQGFLRTRRVPYPLNFISNRRLQVFYSYIFWVSLVVVFVAVLFETGFCHVALGGPKLLAFLSQPSKWQIDVKYLTWLPPQFLTRLMKHVSIMPRLFTRWWCKWPAQFTYNNFLIWKIGGPKLWSLRTKYLKHCIP